MVAAGLSRHCYDQIDLVTENSTTGVPLQFGSNVEAGLSRHSCAITIIFLNQTNFASTENGTTGVPLQFGSNVVAGLSRHCYDQIDLVTENGTTGVPLQFSSDVAAGLSRHGNYVIVYNYPKLTHPKFRKNQKMRKKITL